jgi:hypothetical protein
MKLLKELIRCAAKRCDWRIAISKTGQQRLMIRPDGLWR